MFHKLLIANRGEIAVRIIRACQELGVRTVAVYSEADTSALHTLLADEAVMIGPPAPARSYLCGECLIEVARQTGCEAIHPGYGFLAENADFAEAVAAAGLVFIGPSPEAMRAMGTKTSARATMQAAGVPVVPGYQESDAETDLLAAAESLGYPLVVKASAGGGGKGMRLVHSTVEMPHALQSARREAIHAFGDGRLYLEKYLASPHHIEFQVFGDAFGNAVHLFERECSAQRRHQKIIEETPSPLLDDDLRRRMGKAAIAAMRAVNYTNAGTLEFLVDADRNFYFLEMNTRLQVEHPITEMVTGRDLVKAQLRVAAGEPLPFRQADLSQRGHAIECRIYAEDPANNFLPATGPILRTVEPARPGVRVDTGIITGDEVTLHYDPLIAKLIAYGENRQEAVARMEAALRQYTILGVTTNIPFLRHIVQHPVFLRGEVTTDFVEQHLAEWQPNDTLPPDLTLAAAALAELYEREEETKRQGGEEAREDRHSPWRELKDFRVGAWNSTIK